MKSLLNLILIIYFSITVIISIPLWLLSGITPEEIFYTAVSVSLIILLENKLTK